MPQQPPHTAIGAASKCAQTVAEFEIGSQAAEPGFDVCEILSLPHFVDPPDHSLLKKFWVFLALFQPVCLSVCLSLSGKADLRCLTNIRYGLAWQISCPAWHGMAMADLRCLSAPTTSSTRLSPPSSQVLLILSQTLPACPPDCILYHSFSPPLFLILLSFSIPLSLS